MIITKIDQIEWCNSTRWYSGSIAKQMEVLYHDAFYHFWVSAKENGPITAKHSVVRISWKGFCRFILLKSTCLPKIFAIFSHVSLIESRHRRYRAEGGAKEGRRRWTGNATLLPVIKITRSIAINDNKRQWWFVVVQLLLYQLVDLLVDWLHDFNATLLTCR